MLAHAQKWFVGATCSGYKSGTNQIYFFHFSFCQVLTELFLRTSRWLIAIALHLVYDHREDQANAAVINLIVVTDEGESAFNLDRFQAQTIPGSKTEALLRRFHEGDVREEPGGGAGGSLGGGRAGVSGERLREFAWQRCLSVSGAFGGSLIHIWAKKYF